MKLRNISIVGRIDGELIAEGNVNLGPVEKALRIKRAVRNSAICFALMIGSVFVPMLHFILVPGFFLLTIFLGLNAYFDDVEITDGEITCQKCQSKIVIGKHGDHWPLWAKCEKCNKDVRIEKAHSI